MLELFQILLSSQQFIPHGHCYLWQSELVWLHVASDLLIALAYYAIALSLFHFVGQRSDVPIQKIFWMFGAFIIACGSTHIMEVWTLWYPTYWLSGAIKAFTAGISLYTAVELVPLIPQAIALPSPAQLEAANQALYTEIAQRQKAEAALQQVNEQLEIRIEERTAQLKQAADQLLIEIVKRHQIQEALQESEALLRNVLDTLPVGVWVTDKQGQICQRNPAGQRIWGGAKYVNFNQYGEYKGWWADTGKPIETHEWALFRAITKGETSLNEVIEIESFDGKRKTLLNSALPLRNAQKEIIGAIALNQDITEQRLVEKALWENQRLIQQIAEATPTILYLYDLIEQRNIYVNQQIFEILGHSPVAVQAMGSSFLQNLTHPDDWVKITENMQRLVTAKDGEIVETEYRMKHANGEWRWLYSRHIVFIRTTEGLPQQILGTATDITSRKQAEEALRTSEKQLRAVFESAMDAMAIADDNGQFVTVNPSAGELFGLPPEELIGRTIADFLEPGFDFAHAWQSFQERERERGELRLMRPDGTTRDIEYAAIASFLPHRHLSVMRDVSFRKRTEAELNQYRDRLEELVHVRTGELRIANQLLQQEIGERQQAEEALWESERRFRAIFDHTFQFTGLMKPDGTLLEANQTALKFGGIQHSDVVNRPLWQTRWWTISKATQEQLQAAIAKGAAGEFVRYEVDILGAGETVATIDFSIKPIKDETGQVVLLIPEGRDISDRKRAESELQRSEEKYRTLAKTFPNGVVHLFDRQLRYTLSEGTILPKLGLSPAMMEGKTMWEVLPKSTCQILEPFYRAALAGESQTFEIPFAGVHFIVHVSPVQDSKGEIIGGMVVAQDISDRRQMEVVLRESQAKYKTLFEILPLGISITDEQGNLIEVNPASERILGISMTEHTTRKYDSPEWRIIRPDGTPMPASDFPSVIALRENRVIENAEAGIVKKEGEVTWISITAAPIPLSGYGVAIAYVDITFRKQAEAALRESEERFRQIFADAPIGMALASTDGQFRQINKALCEMLGYTESELTNLTFRDITYSADLEKELPYVEQCLKGEISNYQLEKRYIKKNGELLLINLTSRVIRDPVSKERYGLAMIEDITQRKELEKMKDEFISVASHELRTPLTSLRASLGLLSTGRLGVLSEQGQRLLGFAVTDTDRLVRLVNDILDLERLRFRKMTLIRQICDAAELLQGVVGIMQPIAQKAGVTLSIVPVSLSVWADCDRIIQVLTNLLSNAIKFSPQGSTICLSAEEQGNQILFQVKDQGRGIPVEQLEIIFEPFKQVDASDSRQKGGTGLGLAICRSIIQQHGGEIWVMSTLGQGSTFCFTLPMPLEE